MQPGDGGFGAVFFADAPGGFHAVVLAPRSDRQLEEPARVHFLRQVQTVPLQDAERVRRDARLQPLQVAPSRTPLFVADNNLCVRSFGVPLDHPPHHRRIRRHQLRVLGHKGAVARGADQPRAQEVHRHKDVERRIGDRRSGGDAGEPGVRAQRLHTLGAGGGGVLDAVCFVQHDHRPRHPQKRLGNRLPVLGEQRVVANRQHPQRRHLGALAHAEQRSVQSLARTLAHARVPGLGHHRHLHVRGDLDAHPVCVHSFWRDHQHPVNVACAVAVFRVRQQGPGLACALLHQQRKLVAPVEPR